MALGKQIQVSNLIFFIPLLFGGLIYLLFRPTGLLMFRWLDGLGLLDDLLMLRKVLCSPFERLPNWFLYSLPDALWFYSFISLFNSIWKWRISKENIFWFLIIIVVGLGSEVLQYFKMIRGTYDKIDLILLTFALGLAIVPTVITFFKMR